MGTVRQIEAGDELSGSIINPHPLLFNILKTPTTHTEQSSASVQHGVSESSKAQPNVKGICCIPKGLRMIYLHKASVFHCILEHLSLPEQKDKKKHDALLKGNHNKVLLKHSQQSPFQLPAGDELKAGL